MSSLSRTLGSLSGLGSSTSKTKKRSDASDPPPNTEPRRRETIEQDASPGSPTAELVSDRVTLTPSPLHQYRRAGPASLSMLPPQRPEHKGRLTVVLDMDETLIHSIFVMGGEFRQDEARKECTRAHDFEVDLDSDDPNAEVETALVYLRPFLSEFLCRLSEFAEVVVFTAALPVYAKPVLDRIDPMGYIHHRLYRDSTVCFKGQPFVKDLSLLGREMSRCLLIDNNPFAMIATPDNSMPILSYYDDLQDEELGKALAILRVCDRQPDIREYLGHNFSFRQQLRDILGASENEQA